MYLGTKVNLYAVWYIYVRHDVICGETSSSGISSDKMLMIQYTVYPVSELIDAQALKWDYLYHFLLYVVMGCMCNKHAENRTDPVTWYSLLKVIIQHIFYIDICIEIPQKMSIFSWAYI